VQSVALGIAERDSFGDLGLQVISFGEFCSNDSQVLGLEGSELSLQRGKRQLSLSQLRFKGRQLRPLVRQLPLFGRNES
jgi:hypothetical protein